MSRTRRTSDAFVRPRKNTLKRKRLGIFTNKKENKIKQLIRLIIVNDVEKSRTNSIIFNRHFDFIQQHTKKLVNDIYNETKTELSLRSVDDTDINVDNIRADSEAVRDILNRHYTKLITKKWKRYNKFIIYPILKSTQYDKNLVNMIDDYYNTIHSIDSGLKPTIYTKDVFDKVNKIIDYSEPMSRAVMRIESVSDTK